MKQTHLYDYLIIGQGLAGSILAWQLMQHRKRVLVLDNQHKNSSSWVAAGLINPLAGKRFNCPTQTDAWLASAHALYQALEKHFKQQYWQAIDMQRLFAMPEQQRYYQKQRNQGSKHLGDKLKPQAINPNIRAPHGGFQQFHTGYIKTQKFLSDLAAYLREQQALAQQHMDYAAFTLHSTHIGYADIKAAQVVFCEGYRLQQNPWFQWLPLQPDKGEILDLHSQQILTQQIINGSHWLIPTGANNYRFGSTHEHELIDTQPTAIARKQLAQGLNHLLHDTSQVHITQQQAGVRPATPDRHPFIGTHPTHKNLHVFNGFGGRGALTIPWYAEHFRDYLLQQTPLVGYADIQRYLTAL